MPAAIDVVRAQHAYLEERSPDATIAALAELQHGVVAYRQLIALGISREAVQHRVESGRLHRLYRGVFAVGHRVLTPRARWMAAVLAAGPGAVLSHRSAAELRELLDPWDGPSHVTVPRARRARPGLRVHLSRLPSDERDMVDGIATTTVARTVFDLAATARPRTVKRAFDQAEFLRLTSPVGVPALLERHPRRPGAAQLRRLVTARGRHRTRIDMEDDFLEFCDEQRIPRPDATNVSRLLHGSWIEADAVYLDARLIVELDGGSHLTERRFHSDRSRDRSNLIDGWWTVRVTSRHLDDERDQLARDLAALLGRS